MFHFNLFSMSLGPNNSQRTHFGLSLVPRGLRLKSPLNTQEAIQIVKATCRWLIRARINDCHRRLNYYNDKYNNDLTNLNDFYRLPYLVLYRLLRTNALTRQLNSTARKRNKNWRDCKTQKTLNDVNPTQAVNFFLKVYIYPKTPQD